MVTELRKYLNSNLSVVVWRVVNGALWNVPAFWNLWPHFASSHLVVRGADLSCWLLLHLLTWVHRTCLALWFRDVLVPLWRCASYRNFTSFTHFGHRLGAFLQQVNGVSLALWTKLVNSINLQETKGINFSWSYQSSVISIAFSAMLSLAAEFLARLACFISSAT